MVRFAYSDPNANAHDPRTADEKDAERLMARARGIFDKLERHLRSEYPDLRRRILVDDPAAARKRKIVTVAKRSCEKTSACHLLGGRFTAPDFHLWEMLDQFDGLGKRYGICCLGTTDTAFPFLKEFHATFLNLVANRVYAHQYQLNGLIGVYDDTIQLPYNNVYARFASDLICWGRYTRGQEAPWRNRGVVENTFP